MEDGTIILIGATTENPYFEVNGALLSRSIIFELKSLSKEDIRTLILRAVNDREKGLGAYDAVIDDDALEFLADVANGDARAALTAIELGVLTTERSADGKIHITLAVASECIQKRVVKYDKSGDNHYDTISAFIKSMRGPIRMRQSTNLARMLYAGEDIRFIARRIMICAAEDVSNADPMALVVATSAAAGGGAHRYAGGADYFSAGGHLCGERTKEQFCGLCHQRCHGCSAGYHDGADSGAPAGCTL